MSTTFANANRSPLEINNESKIEINTITPSSAVIQKIVRSVRPIRIANGSRTDANRSPLEINNGDQKKKKTTSKDLTKAELIQYIEKLSKDNQFEFNLKKFSRLTKPELKKAIKKIKGDIRTKDSISLPLLQSEQSVLPVSEEVKNKKLSENHSDNIRSPRSHSRTIENNQIEKKVEFKEEKTIIKAESSQSTSPSTDANRSPSEINNEDRTDKIEPYYIFKRIDEVISDCRRDLDLLDDKLNMFEELKDLLYDSY